ncbi:asparaginase [Desulfosarcina sp. OttesenSCG-928-A07]|nr:asparaginase [Desulfosarcina sp. OttesenSCG-928-G17]MDL2328154.1 asparaginase [Desulfosarcina sp. OttesenSCG-928-A07]
MADQEDKGVLIIYTGGTIGCVPSDPKDPSSPLVVAPWDEVSAQIPSLQLLKNDYPIDAESFEKPIDSTNMRPEFWQHMAEVIAENYDQYNGFVILHGTDTMVYTASALSFMLENLSKPVIITGAQLPIVGRPRNDGEQNLITAIMIANGPFYKLPVVPEVCIFFRDKLLRGNRARKISASGYAGFGSPNYPALGEGGEHIVINEALLRKVSDQPLQVRRRLDTGVINFSIFPGVQDGKLLQQVVLLEGLKAMVLQTYGTGNAPTEENFLDVIESATRKDLVVLDVTQCSEGAVELGTYETSIALLDRGVVGAADITPEAAMCKLMVLLGNEDLSKADINRLVQQNLAGEQSLSVVETKYKEETISLEKEKRRHRLPGVDIPGGWNPEDLKKAVLRLRNVELKTPADAPIEISVFLNISSDDALNTNSVNYAGVFKRQGKQVGNTLVFDITKATQKVLRPNQRLPITIAIDEHPEHKLKWKQAELVLHLVDWERAV